MSFAPLARAVAGLVFLSVPLAAQVADLRDITDPPRPARQEAAVKALPALVEASRTARDPALGGLDAAVEQLARLGSDVVLGDRVRVEIVGRAAVDAAVRAAVLANGGELSYERGRRLEASLPIAALEACARALPATWHIVPLGFGQVVTAFEGEGPTIMNDLPYRDAGYDGAGITIAVIDVGYNGIMNSVISGDAPGVWNQYNYTSTSMVAAQSGNHGRFVLETIYDHAPGATYILMKISSQTQAATAVDDAVALGADIISMSIGYFPEWEDGTSELSQAADDAAAAGVLVFNSAGNSARLHWEGDFDDDDGDGFLSWDGDEDEVMQITVPAGATVSIRLTWDRSGGTHDYDMYLYNSDASGLYDWSTQVGDAYEGVSWPNNSPFDLVAQVVVERMAGPGTELEVFASGINALDEHIVWSGSVLSPSNASHSNVISVGAVEEVQYGAAKYACCGVATYSSRGPTNGGQMCPDICAPTSTATSFANSFTGTSCACPHASGLTAALWSVNPAGTAAQVRGLLYEYAARKDWGAVGPDSTYGRGGVSVPPWADCNLNSFPDAFDIASGGSDDDNENDRPDECDTGGFMFGLLGPDVAPSIGFTLLATIDPSSSPTAPLPPVAGFDMVFGFDPAVVTIDSVSPSAELLALLGGAPAEFDVMIVGDAIGVSCDFGIDPTGGPISLPLAVRTEMLSIECSFVPSTGGPGTGPTQVSFGFENQPVGLLVPAVQKVRTASAGGGTGDVVPTETISLNFEKIHVPHHRFALEPGAGVQAESAGGMLVEVDPAAPQTTFSLRWSVREMLEPSVATTGLSAAIALDPATLVAFGATPAGEIAVLDPDLFLVSIGTDGLAIDTVWSSAGITSFAFGLDGAQVADIVLGTSAAFTGAPDGAATAVRFATPASLPLAENNVSGTGLEEAPTKDDGVVVLYESLPSAPAFRRGDVDGNGNADIGDAINILGHLFLGASPPSCVDSADTNDDSTLTIADPVWLLGYLFTSGNPPPAPGPTACGTDPTADTLDCAGGC